MAASTKRSPSKSSNPKTRKATRKPARKPTRKGVDARAGGGGGEAEGPAAPPLSLVTGACGFMGTHMCEVLAEAGHRIRATDLPDACERDDRARGRFPSVARGVGAELVPADVTDPATLEGLFDGVHYVFHIAAIFNYTVPFSVLEKVNVGGTRNLLEALLATPARKRKLKRAVVWGAGGVYGFPSPGIPIVENTPADPPNDYLRSKTLQEELVMDYGRDRGLDWAIIRPTAVYGPRAVYGGGPLIMGPAQMKVLAAPLNFTANIPFVHVRDVCRAALHLATTPSAGGRAYNVSDDSRINTRDFMKHVARLTGSHFVTLPPVPVGPMRSVLRQVGRAAEVANRRLGTTIPLEEDTAGFVEQDVLYDTTALKETGFRFEYPTAHRGIAETIEWYRREGWI